MNAPESAATLTDYDQTLVLLKVEEAARRLRIGRTLCYSLVSSGQIESVTVGRLRRIPADAVIDYVAQLRQSRHTPLTSAA
ncbi:excisionase family DNA-binding protein [Streptomyces sp. AK02-01A]|uniref:excisionase family DNA-binding protein n=1 Tax=Streptomyces sp. AK02-01A TaxID=3028648 RepID=UPI0029B42F31|nr:excisionase family DNA-binding protein [Streptomyces sp. AK02-01A]MDX3855034.1 excisionase family DNA-binding protein [Streptomyces sp. AK02-01A]